mmetsp:Transcript_116393/g.228369  ORF Transcript_116393/g.228369 Transcript_116393/m.228369 type:complete len:272 (-) Transcript_116393:103-918(-)
MVAKRLKQEAAFAPATPAHEHRPTAQLECDLQRLHSAAVLCNQLRHEDVGLRSVASRLALHTCAAAPEGLRKCRAASRDQCGERYIALQGQAGDTIGFDFRRSARVDEQLVFGNATKDGGARMPPLESIDHTLQRIRAAGDQNDRLPLRPDGVPRFTQQNLCGSLGVGPGDPLANIIGHVEGLRRGIGEGTKLHGNPPWFAACLELRPRRTSRGGRRIGRCLRRPGTALRLHQRLQLRCPCPDDVATERHALCQHLWDVALAHVACGEQEA